MPRFPIGRLSIAQKAWQRCFCFHSSVTGYFRAELQIDFGSLWENALVNKKMLNSNFIKKGLYRRNFTQNKLIFLLELFSHLHNSKNCVIKPLSISTNFSILDNCGVLDTPLISKWTAYETLSWIRVSSSSLLDSFKWTMTCSNRHVHHKTFRSMSLARLHDC